MCMSVVVVLEQTLFYSKLVHYIPDPMFPFFNLLTGPLQDGRAARYLVKEKEQWYLYEGL